MHSLDSVNWMVSVCVFFDSCRRLLYSLRLRNFGFVRLLVYILFKKPPSHSFFFVNLFDSFFLLLALTDFGLNLKYTVVGNLCAHSVYAPTTHTFHF